MKILVIGTSNSLMKKGYTYSLRHSKHISLFDNRSLGMSGSCLFARMAEDINFSKYDFCLFDFCVNEETFVHLGLNKDLIRDNLLSLCSEIWRSGALPIMLVWPRNSRPLSTSYVHDLYLNVARDLNIPYFDASGLIERLETEKTFSRDLMFKDDGHLKEWMAIALGNGLIVSLMRLLNLKPFRSISRKWQYYTFFTLKPENVSSQNAFKYRSNTILDATLCNIVPEKSVEFVVSDNVEVVSISLNLAKTSGIIIIEGDVSHYYDFRNDGFSEDDNAFLMTVLPLHSAILPKNRIIRISVMSAKNLPATTYPKQIFPAAQRNAQAENAEIELESIILKNKQCLEVSTKPVPSLHSDLSDFEAFAIACSAIDLTTSKINI